MEAHQHAVAVDRNREFFAGNPEYEQALERLVTYRNIRRAIEGEIRGTPRLLDIGNGGTFPYDTDLAEWIVAVDLFLEELPRASFPPNVEPRSGDALALDEPDGAYDAVLLALVFHHLVGDTADDLLANVDRSIAEAHRVLRDGGRLIVVESCVPEWFYRAERVLFAPLAALSGTRVMRHPPTLQLTAEQLTAQVGARFGDVRARQIAVGRWILQFGRRWPTRLTPARPLLLTARKA